MNTATQAPMREFGFSPEHFRLISERVYRFSGIRLPEGKREINAAQAAAVRLLASEDW